LIPLASCHLSSSHASFLRSSLAQNSPGTPQSGPRSCHWHTGGLICIPIGDPSRDNGFAYTPVDHDQRNTLNVGFNAILPFRVTASTNVYYGSGFHNGNPDPSTPYPNDYLPYNSSVDLSVGRSFGERTTVSVTSTNLVNRRVLLDNSLTFGGFHFNDPRQIFGEVRYRFKF
jgi:hypothetical protein